MQFMEENKERFKSDEIYSPLIGGIIVWHIHMKVGPYIQKMLP